MMRRILALTALLLVAPAGAHAATLTKSGATLTYAATGTTTNIVTFTESTPGSIVVQRSGADDDAITATGCTTPEIDPGRTILCTGITSIVANAGDGDDSLDASALTAARATLSGGDGDDVLAGGAGADSLNGGAGLDRADYVGTPLSVSLDDVADDGRPGEGDNVHSDVEDVSANPGGGSATLAGSDAGNVLSIVTGGGTITGGAGSDQLTGGPGNDAIDARDGYADRVSCGTGTDSVKADQHDQVHSNCENVAREPVVGGADDRPPAVTWSAPASGASLTSDAATTLAVSATDDRGIAKVQFFDDDRLVCEDAAAPYTCAYAPRGADVGRDTLVARAVDTADQSTSAVQAVTVDRFSARSLSLKLSPSRDRKAPYRFNASGKLTLPTPVSRTQGCGDGQITITVKAGKKTVATRRTSISRVCEYKLRITFPHRPASTLRFTARFSGNDVMQAKAAPSRTGRTR
jgi:Ca2+-binding RTX toxin-like protein